MSQLYFEKPTQKEVQDILEKAYTEKARLRFWYGDVVTGKVWNDEYDIIGRIGRSTGENKIPLLISNSRSTGGGAVLTHCIVRIDLVKNHKTVYKHSKFHVDLKISKDDSKVIVNSLDQTEASFDTPEKAKAWLDFMKGNRYTKSTGNKNPFKKVG